MTLKLRCQRRVDLGGRLGLSRQIFVIDKDGNPCPAYELMCSALDEDVQSAGGSGACVLEWIHRIESGELELADVDGNAWIIYITRDKVWFEGLYEQGTGGPVTLAQFKFAVETYIHFLANPGTKPTEVPFMEK